MANSSQICHLCGANQKLEQSHIIPQFVYRWTNGVPGLHERQVGLTRPMLCGRCEDRFSTYESEFARHVFHPVAVNSFLAAKYDGWLRKFAASVCWRILEECIVTHSLPSFPENLIQDMNDCRVTWRQYLLGKRPDEGRYHFHLQAWNLIAGEANSAEHCSTLIQSAGPGRVALPQPIWQTVGREVSCRGPAAFVQAKLGPLVLTGLIAELRSGQRHGTRIHAEGKLKLRDL